MLWPAEREPQFKGRSLTKWTRLYYNGKQTDREAAINAIQHIGTNALPYALVWSQPEISPSKQRLAAALNELPGDAGRGLAYRWVYQEIDRRAAAGLACFKVLGRDAAPAVPELVRRINSTNQLAAGVAMEALPYLGREAIEFLGAMIVNPSVSIRTRLRAISVIGDAGTNAAPALPALLQCLQETNYAAESAVTTLANLRIEPEIVVPALQ